MVGRTSNEKESTNMEIHPKSKTRTPSPTGLELIAYERNRQIKSEGWTEDHDDTHADGELARAAMCYTGRAALMSAVGFRGGPKNCPDGWPWDREWWKPSEDPVRNLVKAGALIAAEIDRLQRAASAPNAKLRDAGESGVEQH